MMESYGKLFINNKPAAFDTRIINETLNERSQNGIMIHFGFFHLLLFYNIDFIY
jgi:hypothetical protein